MSKSNIEAITLSSTEAIVRRKSEQFVKKYPLMFTEDHDFWIDTLTDFFSFGAGKAHLSSCAPYNEPAYPKGFCDCGAEKGIDVVSVHRVLEMATESLPSDEFVELENILILLSKTRRLKTKFDILI